MNHSKLLANRYCRNFAVIRAMLLALAFLPVGCNKDDQQASKAPPEQSPSVQSTTAPTESMPVQPVSLPAAKPLTDLESLVAPIALYPDPLLAELLVASTYPLEVVQAARWLETKPDLATLGSKDWDASILRLASVPLVIKMMNDHLDWTTQLGDAFLAKPIEVMDVIQKLRKRAMDAGFLKDSPEQKVSAQTVSLDQLPEATDGMITPAVLKKEVITIKPAKSDTVFVPQYNPEVVYQAPMASPPNAGYPGSTVVNVNTVAPAPGYYPAYYPAPVTTTTTSTTDAWGSFAAGAVVGGLLTWGIMEWANHNDDYYGVGHYYGNSVCNNGNCWHGGGGGYYGDRGNVNYNKNVNISGNDINIGGGNSFSQNNLRPSQQPAGWQSNPQHRRGQAYPEGVQKRLGANQQPALAGQRLGAAQTLPANSRGFAEAGQRPTASTLQAGRRPSSADIQQQLAQKPGTQDRPATRDVQGRSGQGSRDNALQGIQNSGQASRLESQRGSENRKPVSPATREAQARKPAAGERVQRPQTENSRSPSMERKPQMAQRQAEMPNQAERSQAFAGRERAQQQMETQRRSEVARPNAFEGSRNGSATQNFSQRGASSMQRSASARNQRAQSGARPSAGGGQFGGGGRSSSGGGGRSGGGGGGRR